MVLLGWRETTIDVDIELAPEPTRSCASSHGSSDELRIETSSLRPRPTSVPLPAGYQDRNAFIGREGRLSFYHDDLYSQALSGLERAHRQDLEDVGASSIGTVRGYP